MNTAIAELKRGRWFVNNEPILFSKRPWVIPIDGTYFIQYDDDYIITQIVPI
jgi:hypothetical protein